MNFKNTRFVLFREEFTVIRLVFHICFVEGTDFQGSPRNIKHIILMVHAVSHCGGDTGKRFDPICDIRCHIPVRFDHDQEIRGI